MAMRFSIFPKRCIGIDVGTYSTKVVEISLFRGKLTLENYGEVFASSLGEDSFRTFEKSGLMLSIENVSSGISALIEEARIKTREAVFSLPDFSTFCTNFELPKMAKKELLSAVQYEARRYVPLAPKEVTLDYQTSEKKTDKGVLKILLTAVPNSVINQYEKIGEYSKLGLMALEAEMFSLSRALGNLNLETTAVIDIGAQSTTINIIDQGTLELSYSFDVAGNEITTGLMQGLNINERNAEILKVKYGIGTEKSVRDTIVFYADFILKEIDKITKEFSLKEKKEVKKFILSGGTVLLPGIKDYFASCLKQPVEVAEAFKNILCPPVLKDYLKERGHIFSIALGAAIKGLE